MRWEELTGDRFVEAVKECEGVCLIALSVIERHGHHMPLGTDMYVGREIVTRAAAIEPAIVFPDYIFTQIPEVRHRAGTISIDPHLMIKLLDNVCREAARNGLKKIVLVNAHGGNTGLLGLFNMLPLYAPRDYVIYIFHPASALAGKVDVPWEGTAEDHAGPGETSLLLAVRPDLVLMDEIPNDDEWKALGRLQALREVGVETGVWWYADHPTHYQGDARSADAGVGDRLFDACAQELAKAIRVIKADTETKRLQDEFYAGSESPF